MGWSVKEVPALSMNDKKLTPKQARFVEEYMVDLNATQAAIRAGYSKKTAKQAGTENLAKPIIKAAINEKTVIRSEKTGIDAEWVLKQAARLHERCMQDVKPVLTKKGDPVEGENIETGEYGPLYTFNAAGAAKALEIVGRHVDIQAFADKHIHEHGGEVSHTYTERKSRIDALLAQAKDRDDKPATH